jgi:calcineurin-like phosphoesterase family protein
VALNAQISKHEQTGNRPCHTPHKTEQTVESVVRLRFFASQFHFFLLGHHHHTRLPPATIAIAIATQQILAAAILLSQFINNRCV